MRLRVSGFVLLLASPALACSEPRDVVSPSVNTAPRAGSSANANASPDAATPSNTSREGYVYVARRLHVTVGLAEAREMDPTEANRVIDSLAESFETCAAKLDAEKKLGPGAGRLIVLVDEKGHVTATDAKLAPGSEVAEAALLCLVAPARALAYPPGKGTRRGMAVEAMWESSK
jgi:hypothetical protein